MTYRQRLRVWENSRVSGEIDGKKSSLVKGWVWNTD